MLRTALALALVCVPLTPSASADEGCACNRPRRAVPIYGARAFTHAELARIAGAPPAKGPGGKACEPAAGRVREFYRRRGFIKADVVYEPLMSGDCALRVTEGKRYRLRRVEIGGTGSVSRPEVLEDAGVELGAPWDPAAVDRLVARLNRIRELEPVTSDRVDVRVDDDRAEVDLVVSVTERR
jgi:hypothetical protein